MSSQNPAQAEVLSSGLRVQPDGPLSGEVKREGAKPSRRYLRHQATVAPPSHTACEIYFVQATKLRLVKIGRAKNARARLSELQVGSPDVLILLGAIKCQRSGALERELHYKFRALRVRGEWFRPTPGLLRYIAENAGGALAKGETHMDPSEEAWDRALGLWRELNAERRRA